MVNHEARRLLDIGEDGVGRPVSELGLPDALTLVLRHGRQAGHPLASVGRRLLLSSGAVFRNGQAAATDALLAGAAGDRGRPGPAGPDGADRGNTGPGIAPDEIQHIFECGRTTKLGGVGPHRGIGLTLVNQTVRLLGGTIGVGPGPGATFEIIVPRLGGSHD